MDEISALLQEDRRFPPSDAWRREAIANDPGIYARAAADPEAFWAGLARELEWMTPWSRVLEWNAPYAKWFVGGTLNASVNCLDRHIRGPRRNKAAFIWEGEPGDRRTLTYWDLYREVNAFANVLKSLGVKRGDRVALYLPLIPELAISMLACARIGAVHSVVFGGFSAESLRDRINDQQARLLITADGGYRRGNVVQLKRVADEALLATPSIEHVIVVQRRTNSPFAVEFNRFPTCGQHSRVRAQREEVVEEFRDVVEDVLAVVDHQQHRLRRNAADDLARNGRSRSARNRAPTQATPRLRFRRRCGPDRRRTTPSPNASTSAAAASIATRVLPHPPEPVKVTKRLAARSRCLLPKEPARRE